MSEELIALREMPGLRDLLVHYAALSAPDRQAWHPRQAASSRLHGELIAAGWVEQNTGVLVPGSYRATRAGMKALERLEQGDPED